MCIRDRPIGEEPAATVIARWLDVVAERENARLTEIGQGYTKMFPWVPMIGVAYEALDQAVAQGDEPYASLSEWLGPRQNPKAVWVGRYRLLADLMRTVWGQFLQRTEAEQAAAAALTRLTIEAAVKKMEAANERQAAAAEKALKATEAQLARIEGANAAVARVDELANSEESRVDDEPAAKTRKAQKAS